MFVPKRIIFEKESLEYDMSNAILNKFKDKDVEIINLSSNRLKQHIPGDDGYGKYVYPKENINEIKEFFKKEIEELFSNKEVKYII